MRDSLEMGCQGHWDDDSDSKLDSEFVVAVVLSVFKLVVVGW